MSNKIELRFITELRASDIAGSRKVIGTAAVFEVLSSDLGGFKEIIKKGAITQELLDASDIVMLYNHNKNDVPLARSKNGKGTLKLTLTESGLDFEFTAKKTALGDEILEGIKTGDLSSCSFAFRCAVGGDSWIKDSKGFYTRSILKIDYLQDLSIVINPAYVATNVDTRGLDELKAIESNTTPPETETRDNNTCDGKNCPMMSIIECLNGKIDGLIALVESLIKEEESEESNEGEGSEGNGDNNTGTEERGLTPELTAYYEKLKSEF